MNRSDTIDACELAASLARELPAASAYTVGAIAADLRALERAQHRHAELACSEARYQDRAEAKGDALRRRAEKLLADRFPPGWAVELHGDPRGAVLVLRSPSGKEYRP